MMKPATILFFATSILALTRAGAHEAGPLTIPEAELQASKPAAPGSEVFARAFATRWSGLVPQDRIQDLARISGNLGRLDAAADGSAGLGLREKAWLRWRVGEELGALVESIPSLHVLDFHGGSTLETGPLELDARQGCLVLKVVRGDGPVEFVTHSLDFTSERDPVPYTVATAGRAGTAYVFLTLDEVPAGGESATRLAFKPRDATSPTHWWSFRFKTPASGNLHVDFLDENGAGVPVMARLSALDGQRLLEPAGAADLRPMMNGITSLPIYGPGRGYMMYVPEPWRGPYWVMPGPLDMAVPAGEWDLHVWHGLEYAPVKVRLAVEAGKWTRREVRLQRWIDMGARGWFAGDDHVHARVMNGEDAGKLMAWTRAADISVCNVLEMGDEVRTWYAQRGFGPEFRVRHGNHWIIPGQEDPRGVLGHAIGLNLVARVRNPERYLDQQWVAEEIHRQGGLYGHTHVGAKALFVERQMALYTPFGLVDFNSVLQAALNTELMYHYLNLGYKMTASAGTDTPYGGTVGCVRMYAFAGMGGELDPDMWFRAVKAGRTFVTTGPMLDFQVGEAMPGDEVVTRDDAPLKIRIVADGLAGKSAPKSVRLVRFGKVIKEVAPETQGQQTVVLEHQVQPEDGCWLAAHVIGEDGSEAHSTPVYISRPGLRWWDVERVPDLLRAQQSVLDEIEAMVAESKKLAETRPLDYTLRSVVKGADILLEHVARARAHYEDLGRVRELEMKSRAP